MPQTIDEYVHRIGRTGRCGNLGKAISFIDEESENDRKLARPLVRILTQAQQQVPDWLETMAMESTGSAFTGGGCTDDMRSKFEKTSISTSGRAQETNDENWD